MRPGLPPVAYRHLIFPASTKIPPFSRPTTEGLWVMPAPVQHCLWAVLARQARPNRPRRLPACTTTGSARAAATTATPTASLRRRPAATATRPALTPTSLTTKVATHATRLTAAATRPSARAMATTAMRTVRQTVRRRRAATATCQLRSMTGSTRAASTLTSRRQSPEKK